MKKMDESVRFVKNVWALTKSYWQSEEKKKAYLLLLAIIALDLGRGVHAGAAQPVVQYFLQRAAEL